MEEIKSLIDAQSDAIRNKDVEAATANYSADVILFDIIGPLQHKGADSVKKRLIEWFATFDENTQPGFEMVDVTVNADNNLAFSYGFNHISTKLKTGDTLDMFWRETLCWQKQNGQWKIVSAHSSVPFDVESGLGQTGLKP